MCYSGIANSAEPRDELYFILVSIAIWNNKKAARKNGQPP
jgi:hypothetical protein